ncbi:hypothetical protein HDV00_008432 [Rhizophlyctis rosea]|nr:hypothetical protein HDV00_008432 [Rhizophlyctis rosea]
MPDDLGSKKAETLQPRTRRTAEKAQIANIQNMSDQLSRALGGVGGTKAVGVDNSNVPTIPQAPQPAATTPPEMLQLIELMESSLRNFNVLLDKIETDRQRRRLKRLMREAERKGGKGRDDGGSKESLLAGANLEAETQGPA